MRHYPGAEWLVVEREAAAIGRLYFVHWSRESRIRLLHAAGPQQGFRFGGSWGSVDEAKEKVISIHVERMNPALSLYRRLGFETAEDKGVYLLLERRR